MGKFYKIIWGAAIGLLTVMGVTALSNSGLPAILNPMGVIAAEQRNLIIIATLLMLTIVIPVFVLTIVIAWRYRAGNKRALYSPNLSGNRYAEILWWGVPLIMIMILSAIIWRSSHQLDPYKPIISDAATLRVQVVALKWKWLFLYPEHGVASVSDLPLPINQPISLQLTADAPMNSFWVPQLGGQIYAMPGMSTRLQLMATTAGSYAGSSANLSGEGFADMRFTTRAMNREEFDSWVTTTKATGAELNSVSYEMLNKPTSGYPVTSYVLSESNLYDTIVGKYMSHSHEGSEHNAHE